MSDERRLRVLVVDAHPLVQDSLCRVRENSGAFEVVGQTFSGEQAIALSENLCPDAVIMDLIMAGMDGVEACREIVERLPGTRVLMLTASTDDDAVAAAVAAGPWDWSSRTRACRTSWRPSGTTPDSALRPEAGLRRGSRPVGACPRGEVPCAHGAGGADRVRQRQFLRRHCEHPGQQPLDRPQHHLPDSGQVGSRFQTGPGGLGRAQPPCG